MMKRRLANAYLSSVISITLVLLLIGVAAFVVINSGSVARYLKENVKISVLFVQNATEQDAEEYLGSVRALPYVHDTRLITREEGERELAEMLGEDFLDVFETSPVPISVDVTLNAEYVVPDSLAFVSEVLAASPMVEEVDSQQPLVAILNENLAKISAVFGVFILLLLFISFVLINNMVRLSVFARRFTIHTMKLVGATKAFIRAPFLRGALLQGLISAFLASAAIWGIYYAARSSFSELFEIFDIVTLLESTGIIFVCGVLICVLSTYFVVGRLVSANKDELYY
ncbi:MAG: ABC transporter permease [Bacteroidetes bacterium]|uniref:Cell division protein FtsX n=1 Tax=Candidatus Cryptobacteroides avistercoris TaxID=2840758 RepID=A0A9D9IXW6_9BACT|nr:ABC transporter permease [Candidatus Cryptobacteroides avistercoris]